MFLQQQVVVRGVLRISVLHAVRIMTLCATHFLGIVRERCASRAARAWRLCQRLDRV